MKILVISDTHGRGAKLLSKVIEREGIPDLMLHLGDFLGEIDTLAEIAGCEVQAVRGNCDWDFRWPLTTMVEAGKHMIFLAHGFTLDVDYSLDDLEQLARDSDADIAIYGHLHIPYLEEKEDGFILLNPGSLGRSRTMDEYEYYAIIEIDEEDKVQVTHKMI